MNTIKSNLKPILAAMFAAVLLLTLVPGMKADAASSGRYVKITAVDGVNVHTGPSTVYRVEGKLSNGESARVLSWKGTWIEVEYNGGVGYIMYNASWETMYWSDSNNGEGSTSSIIWYNLGSNYIAECTASSLYVHSSPSTTAAKSGYLSRGQYVTATRESLRWVEIKYYNNAGNYVTGYVARAYVDLQQKAQYTGESFWATNGNIRIDVNNLFVHNAPALTDANRYNVNAKNGEVYTVLAQSEHWYKINFKGSTGYVIKQYVTYYAANVKVKLSDTDVTMEPGDLMKISVQNFKSTRTKLNIKSWKWKTSKSSVVKITKAKTNSKKSTYCKITAKKNGTAKVYFYYKLGSKWHRVSCKITVDDADTIDVVDDDL